MYLCISTYQLKPNPHHDRPTTGHDWQFRLKYFFVIIIVFKIMLMFLVCVFFTILFFLPYNHFFLEILQN